MKTKIKFNSFLALALILLKLSPALASGEIKGYVTDSVNGSPLTFAQVAYTINGKQGSVFTEDDGSYVLKPLDPGNYEISVFLVGYRKMVVSGVKVTDNKITYQNFQMVSSEGTNLAPVVIKPQEELINPWGPIPSINCTNIGHNANAKQPLEIVATVPGVIKDERSNDFYFRGSRATSNQIFIDGEKLIGPFDVVSSAIESMMVYTGGTPAQYGDFTGGIIVITTKSYQSELTRRRILEESDNE